MKISMVNSPMVTQFGVKESLRMLKDGGFDGTDLRLFNEAGDKLLSPNFETYFESIGNYAEEIGLEISQVHAPFPTWVQSNSEEENEKIVDSVLRAIIATKQLKSKYLVVHPPIMSQRKYTDYKSENRELGIRFYQRLKPLAKEMGIKIALENMWNYDLTFDHICPSVLSTPEELIEWNDILGREQFTVCLDIGHCPLTQVDPAKALRTLGDYVEVLHVHDVDGRYDLHTTPFLSKIRWDEVCKALADIDYKGVLSLEAFPIGGTEFPKELSQAGIVFQAEVARYLANQVEELKSR